MPTSPPRPRPCAALAGVAALSATLTLAGCGTGFDTGSVEVYTAPNGTDLRQADVDVLGALVVADGAGGGTLVAGLVGLTDTPDELVSVDLMDAESTPLETTIADDAVKIPAGELVQVAEDAAVTVSGESLEPGHLLTATFTFANSGPASGDLLVVSGDEEQYADVPVPPGTPS